MRHRKSALADLRTFIPISGFPDHMVRDALLRSVPHHEAETDLE
jgi:hypothetical protein